MSNRATLSEVLPPLEQGDRLSRGEFERRYRAMPHVKKAELIEGAVHMPSPVRLSRHAQPHGQFIGWLFVYSTQTPGVTLADNATIRLDMDNEFQPDGMLLIDPALGGSARISEDDYVEGGPELVGEISSSSVSIDLNVKLQVYRRNRVPEYLVWRVLEKQVDWFKLADTEYVRMMVDADGWYRSQIFPGLWLDPTALVENNGARLLEVLQKGLASPEHAAFVARLKAKA